MHGFLLSQLFLTTLSRNLALKSAYVSTAGWEAKSLMDLAEGEQCQAIATRCSTQQVEECLEIM